MTGRDHLDALFQMYAAESIQRWSHGLRFFRLCLSTPVPHANDGERFLAALRFADEAALLDIMQALDIILKRLPANYQVPRVVGQESPIPDFPHMAQPSHQKIAGVSTFVWVTGGIAVPGVVEIQITDPDNHYVVSERAYQGAKRVETLLLHHQQHIVDPPLDHWRCICPKYYPQLWEGTG